MKQLTILCLLLMSLSAMAQFTIIQGSTGNIQNNVSTNFYNLTATGLTSSHITDGVCMEISHPDLASLSFSLIAPDGTSVLLTENQVSGTTFDRTCFSVGSNNDITTASSPYNAFYQPIGNIADVNNGQDLNGTWQLAISFTSTVTTTGTVDYWEMGFFNNGNGGGTGTNCLATLDVPSVTASNTYLADSLLTSNAVLQNSIDVSYYAGTTVCLENGFEVQLNSIFLADIEGCASDFIVAGTTTLDIPQSIDGIIEDRPVYIQAPSNILTTQQYPVLFYFHGNGGNASQFLNNPSLNTIIENEGVIGIYPQGFNNAWNLGPENTNADEMEFMDLLFAELSTYGNVDLSRVYAIGSSNGAAIINQIALERTYFNAIAPVVSQLNVNQGMMTPPRTIAVYQVNGDSDGLIPVNGGTSAVGQTFLSAQASAEHWAGEFNCNLTPISTTDSWGGFPVNSYEYNNCDAGVVVSYHIVVGGTHGVTNGADTGFVQRMWDFLKQF